MSPKTARACRLRCDGGALKTGHPQGHIIAEHVDMRITSTTQHASDERRRRDNR
jgi:hypothetical protein